MHDFAEVAIGIQGSDLSFREGMEDKRMKKTFGLVMGLLFLFSACTSSHLIKTESDRAKANEDLEDRNVDVVLTNGEMIKARNVVVENDSIRLLDSKSNLYRMIPVSEVLKMGIHKPVENSIKGGCLGLLAAVPLRALQFTDEWDKPESKHIPGFLPFLISGSAGALMSGLAVQDFYRFSGSEPAPPVHSEARVVVEGKLVVLSDRVGEAIDLQERNQYGLFPGLEGYQSAELRLHDDGSYWFYVTQSAPECGTENLFKMPIDEHEVHRVRAHIDQFQ
jgi:hypothetical protein